MSQPPIACNREALRLSIIDRLSEPQEHALADHLADCPACREELEKLAATERDWTNVGAALKAEASGELTSEAAVGHDEIQAVGHDEIHAVVHDDWDSPADFAVQFLQPSSQPGSLGKLGDIEILQAIGRGGMGVVLKGFQPELHRPVAVKVLAPHLASSGAARRRFAREAQATAAIVHPNVMPVLTVNSAGPLPYLVMPYVACETLQQRLDRQGPLPPLDVLRIGVQAARALAAAHAQGLIHRDVKPANILLERGVDRVMLTDFGLARAVDDASLTRSGVIAGTPQYMSPEQARGESIDARSDLFSLASVLFAMAAGRPPFRAETSYGILRRITDDEPRPLREISPEAPVWLAALIGKLHAKSASDRFASAAEVAEILEQCLAHLQQPTVAELPAAVRELIPTDAPPQVAQEPARPILRRRGAIVAISASAAIVLAILGISKFGPWQKSLDAPADGAMVDGEAVQESPSGPFEWDDAATSELGKLRGDSESLESRANQLWDDARIEITPQAEQESKP